MHVCKYVCMYSVNNVDYRGAAAPNEKKEISNINFYVAN